MARNDSLLGSGGYALTPSDSTEYNPPLKTVYSNDGGDVTVDTVDDASKGRGGTKYTLTAGSNLPVRNIVKVYAAGTTSVDLVAIER